MKQEELKVKNSRGVVSRDAIGSREKEKVFVTVTSPLRCYWSRCYQAH